MIVRIVMAAAKQSEVGVRLTRRQDNHENLGRLEALFDELDTNKDGVLDAGELIAGITRKGYTHISEDQIKVGVTNQGRCFCTLLLYCRSPLHSWFLYFLDLLDY